MGWPSQQGACPAGLRCPMVPRHLGHGLVSGGVPDPPTPIPRGVSPAADRPGRTRPCGCSPRCRRWLSSARSPAVPWPSRSRSSTGQRASPALPQPPAGVGVRPIVTRLLTEPRAGWYPLPCLTQGLAGPCPPPPGRSRGLAGPCPPPLDRTQSAWNPPPLDQTHAPSAHLDAGISLGLGFPHPRVFLHLGGPGFPQRVQIILGQHRGRGRGENGAETDTSVLPRSLAGGHSPLGGAGSHPPWGRAGGWLAPGWERGLSPGGGAVLPHLVVVNVLERVAHHADAHVDQV